MLWFGGSIAEAVALSKQRNAIFVVFVEGDNAQSTELTATLESEPILKRLSAEGDFLSIKLQSGSENYVHFARIYQFVPVPSLFFIGRHGTPLEVVCAGIEPANLAARIDRILLDHRKDSPHATQPTQPIQPSTSTQIIRDQTANLLQSEATVAPAVAQPATTPFVANPVAKPVAKPVATPVASSEGKTSQARARDEEEPETSAGHAAKLQKTEHHEVTKSGQEYEVVCDGDVCVRRPVSGAGPSAPAEPTEPTPVEQPPTETQPPLQPSPSSEEAQKRAKELLEAIRREKAQKEKELEKQKELERRNLGQGVAELKRWQQDQEMKQAAEERKREKLEDNAARQRILAQIAQDRAERRARTSSPAVPAQTVPETTQTSPNTSGDAGARARIQFKLPDGTSHTAHFDADSTLASVQLYVADTLQLSQSNFALWMAFPRRELTEAECSLRQLELAPSAALLVLRRGTAAVTAQGGGQGVIAFLMQLFTTMIYAPALQLYARVRQYMFPAGGAGGGGGRGVGGAVGGAGAGTGLWHRPRTTNIHRLTGDRSDDDDNNTWNGNSTQQM